MKDIISFTQDIFTFPISTEQGERIKRSVRTAKYAQEHSTTSLEADELIGDKVLQLIIVEYCNEMEPFCLLRNLKKCEAIYTRITIKYLSTKYLSILCKIIHLDRFIDYLPNEDCLMDKIYEDAFEAWIGACFEVFGHHSVKKYLFDLFSQLNIDYCYESLYDAKTRLNDFASHFEAHVSSRELQVVDKNVHRISMTISKNNFINESVIGEGKTQNEASKNAAEKLLEKISVMQWYRDKIVSVPSYRLWKDVFENKINSSKRKNQTKDINQKRRC
jgi:dsRNA-specific ribonuclease